MKARFAAVLALGTVLVSGSASAQEDATAYVFGEYYVCDQNREAFSDVLAEHVFGPMFDRHLEAGNLIGWGWLGHNAGGEWRRAQYYVSTDLNTLLDTRDAIIEEVQAEAAAEGREFTDVCPDHDDYIWASVATSEPVNEQVAERPEAGYSTYFVCSAGAEARADEILQEVYAPILDRHVAAGHFNSWGWYAHLSGGKFRRLLTLDGADHKAILAGVMGLNADIDAENAEAGEEFASICHSHDDYMWDIQISHPQGG
jgi:hypothetical protein